MGYDSSHTFGKLARKMVPNKCLLGIRSVKVKLKEKKKWRKKKNTRESKKMGNDNHR